MAQYYAVVSSDEDHLEHYGVKGQQWGVRRYQNPDGSLTPEGLRRYGKNASSIQRGLNKLDQSKAEYNRDRSANAAKGETYTDDKIRQTDVAVNQLLKIAKDKDLKVSQRDFVRDTDRGERVVSAILFNLPGLLAANLYSTMKYSTNGTKYKVANNSRKKKRIDRSISKIDSDIHSYDPIRKTGVKDKSGRTLLSPEDVELSVSELEKRKKKLEDRRNNL